MRVWRPRPGNTCVVSPAQHVDANAIIMHACENATHTFLAYSTSLPQTNVRWSKCWEDTEDEDFLERAERLVAIRNLEEPPAANDGMCMSFDNSILSVSDFCITSNIQNWAFLWPLIQTIFSRVCPILNLES